MGDKKETKASTIRDMYAAGKTVDEIYAVLKEQYLTAGKTEEYIKKYVLFRVRKECRALDAKKTSDATTETPTEAITE